MRTLQLSKPKRLLVWEQFSAHKSVDTQAVLKQLKLEMVLVPAGCTRFVQPADVNWNAPFKRKLRSFYDQWMLDGDHAWDAVTEDVIVCSFKARGISTALDGSKDDLIHCLKEENGMPNGVGSLVQARHEANAQHLEEIIHDLELEAPEDPEDDAANNASDVSVISGGTRTLALTTKTSRNPTRIPTSERDNR
ncbi:pogo transposable element with KRAB domain-like protein [Aphelenchoides avenae]|nr:pogo transposable element with KRAB domain-like protein [Aphelenchus avenae]